MSKARAVTWVSFFLLSISVLFLKSSQGQPAKLDLQTYRTPASPGELHEDAAFLKEIVEFLAKDIVLAPVVARGDQGFESFDIRIDRVRVKRPDGSWKRDRLGRPVFSATPAIEIKGENYKQIARAYLEWRRGFELAWIQAERGATGELKPTPIKLVFDHPTLPRSEKVRETVQFYRINTTTRIPKPTPNPAYWPVSPILELPECGVQVQFNLRGGQVTVLDSESNRVWVLPYPPEVDPNRWMDEYKREVKKGGKEQAAERLRREAIEWGLPPGGSNPRPSPTPPPTQRLSEGPLSELIRSNVEGVQPESSR